MKHPLPGSMQNMGVFAQVAAQQAQAKLQQAWALHQSGQLAEALALYQQVLQQQPKHFDALHLTGVIYLQSGDPLQAIDWFDKAIKVDRDNANAYHNRGAAHAELRNFELALSNCNKAIALDAASFKGYNSRGHALLKLNRLEEALQDFDKAIAIQPDYFAAHNNRGIVLSELKRYEEAQTSFAKAIELDADSVDAHWNLGMCLLRLGDFECGWRESEWRLKRPDALGLQAAYAMPMWTGAEPLAGKTVLLCCEQGLGDTIQFARYAPLIQAMGAKVVLEVQPSLVPLFQHLPEIELVAQGNALPAHDFYCPLMSLPMLLKTDLSNIPPTLDAIRLDDQQLGKWRAILGDKRKPRVGIVWSGNPSHVDDLKRSITLKALAPFLTEACEWVSLHQEVRPSDLPALTSTKHLAHFGDQIRTFTDTAALCQLMDVIVTVDTSVAHLAGSLGKPTWVLLPYNADWRWLVDRSDNPWYASVKVYRQPKPGDWQSVLQQVQHDLKHLLS